MQKWQALIDAQGEEDAQDEDDVDKQTYEAYQKGSDCYRAGDFAGSAKAWSEALECNRLDAHAFWQRGAAKEHMGDIEGAIDDYSESLRIDSGASQTGVFFSRASARSESGDEDGAIADWSEVVRLEPEWTEAWCCRGTAKLGLGDPQGAAADADEALRLDRDYVGAWGLRGAAKQMLEDHVGAVADCRKALQLDPSLTWVRATLERSCEAAPEETAEVRPPEEPSPAPAKEVLTEPMPSVERLHELIRGVYERKNPQKLAELDQLFAKYEGKEMIMYAFICKKYGEEPIRFIDESTSLEGGNAQQKTNRGYVDGASKKGVPAAEAKVEKVQYASHREEGNQYFKQGLYRRAITAYEASFKATEEGWILALSNRAICHLKLKEYELAVQMVDRCIEQDGVQDVPLKVYLTKFKALAENHDWIQAFATLRKLRARVDLPADVEAAALQEERAKRKQHAEHVADELSSSDEEDEEVFSGDPGVVSRSLARAVNLVLPQSFSAKSICLIGLFGEKPDLFKEELIKFLPASVSEGCDVHSAARQEACQTLKSQVPDLVVLCRPDLSGTLEDWTSLIQHLIREEILTVVTGFCDTTLVENEDILRALGCIIVSETIGCFDADAEHCDPHPHHHVLAFRGGHCQESLDLQSLKQDLIDRGLNIPALTGLD